MEQAAETPIAGKRHEAAHRVLPRVILLLILATAGAGWWYYTNLAAPLPTGIAASGTVEAEEVSVASELAGRVTRVMAVEGDSVRAGDVLVRLDDSALQLQYRMAPAAERQLLEIQIDKTSIRAPMDGVVSRNSIHVGEVASPAATLMVISRQDPVELTLYVPEQEIGRVKVGQRVEVKVDSFPGAAFPGTVSFINSKAEFTPRNVQTQKDRQNLVFAVKVLIPNGDLRLKPGMPADALIGYE